MHRKCIKILQLNSVSILKNTSENMTKHKWNKLINSHSEIHKYLYLHDIYGMVFMAFARTP